MIAAPLQRPLAVAVLAYEAIRDMLIEGSLREDERVVEAALSLRLGISRTPVREALARLANEGFLVSERNGYRAPKVGAQDIINMSQVRALLEPEAARQAAANPEEVGIAEMRDALVEAEEAHARGDGNAVAAANRAYRLAWCKRVRNPMLLEALTKVMSSLQLVRRRTMADASLRGYILDMQRALLQRIECRDAAGAAAVQLERVKGLNSLLLQRLYPGTAAKSDSGR